MPAREEDQQAEESVSATLALWQGLRTFPPASPRRSVLSRTSTLSAAEPASARTTRREATKVRQSRAAASGSRRPEAEDDRSCGALRVRLPAKAPGPTTRSLRVFAVTGDGRLAPGTNAAMPRGRSTPSQLRLSRFSDALRPPEPR